jgi:hypothetical protein
MISAEDKVLFEKHQILFDSLNKHSFVRNYTKEVYHELISLYIKYVTPKHNFSHWCSSCRTELVHNLYTWYNANNADALPQIINEEPKINLAYKQPRKKRNQ